MSKADAISRMQLLVTFSACGAEYDKQQEMGPAVAPKHSDNAPWKGFVKVLAGQELTVLSQCIVGTRKLQRHFLLLIVVTGSQFSRLRV